MGHIFKRILELPGISQQTVFWGLPEKLERAVSERVVVCNESIPRVLTGRAGRVRILPVNIFLEALWGGGFRLG